MKDTVLKAKVTRFMRKSSVPLHIKGYEMMQRAIEIRIDHMGWTNDRVYMEIASERNINYKAVARNIRTAIEASYPLMDKAVKKDIFGDLKKTPGTGAYITSVAYAIKNNLI